MSGLAGRAFAIAAMRCFGDKHWLTATHHSRRVTAPVSGADQKGSKGTDSVSNSGEDRQQRQAKALRANLRRRKAQSRARTSAGTSGHRERPIRPASTEKKDGQAED